MGSLTLLLNDKVELSTQCREYRCTTAAKKQFIIQEEEDDKEEDEEAGADEEVVLPEGVELDPVVMSTLPPSMQVLYLKHTPVGH